MAQPSHDYTPILHIICNYILTPSQTFCFSSAFDMSDEMDADDGAPAAQKCKSLKLYFWSWVTCTDAVICLYGKLKTMYCTPSTPQFQAPSSGMILCHQGFHKRSFEVWFNLQVGAFLSGCSAAPMKNSLLGWWGKKKKNMSQDQNLSLVFAVVNFIIQVSSDALSLSLRNGVLLLFFFFSVVFHSWLFTLIIHYFIIYDILQFFYTLCFYDKHVYFDIL